MAVHVNQKSMLASGLITYLIPFNMSLRVFSLYYILYTVSTLSSISKQFQPETFIQIYTHPTTQDWFVQNYKVDGVEEELPKVKHVTFIIILKSC